MSIYKELAEIVKILQPKKFLEIGVYKGANLKAIDCPYKVGIDPKPIIEDEFSHKVYKGNSDKVFKSVGFKENEKSFDLIFIDGFHNFRQILKDISNSLSVLSPYGMVVCHDVYPFDCLSRYPHLVDKEYPGEGISWTGDAWKTIFYVKYCMTQLGYCVVSTFPGYLYLWRIPMARDEDELMVSVEHIDALTIDFALKNIDAMNIVSVGEVLSFKDQTRKM